MLFSSRALRFGAGGLLLEVVEEEVVNRADPLPFNNKPDWPLVKLLSFVSINDWDTIELEPLLLSEKAIFESSSDIIDADSECTGFEFSLSFM